MGRFSTAMGIVTLFMFIFVSHNVIRRLGWKAGALTTPVMLLVTGLPFLCFIEFREYLMGFLAMFGTTPLMMAVIFGAAQNIMSKSTKYSMFDPTKEMAYIPLDQEQKIKGKAAIDVVGARMGKSGGSLCAECAAFCAAFCSGYGALRWGRVDPDHHLVDFFRKRAREAIQQSCGRSRRRWHALRVF